MGNTRSFPFVSVIVPVYNGEQTIEKCVQSLQSQDYPRDCMEIIIVDNNSKDLTFSVLQPYASSGQIVLLSESKVLNAYGARNTGIRSAGGEILAFTDADCEAEGGWLRELVGSFGDPKVGCVAGEIVPRDPKNVFEKYGGRDFLSQRKGVGMAFPPVKGGNCAFKKEVFARVGLFREDFPSGGDTELAWRMAQLTDLTIKVNLDAMVKHHNVSSLQIFFKQSMRYGTHVYLFTQLPFGGAKPRPSLVKVAYASLTFAAVFVKRFLLTVFGRVPSSVLLQDRDIYLAQPLLRILSEWGLWFGYRYALNNPQILR